MSSLKHQLHALCLQTILDRITRTQGDIQHVQLAANEETKSSAGDKYETGRAMAQLEIEKSSAQLAESLKLKQQLEKISPDQFSTTIQTGSLVHTNHGNFYIAVSIGQLVMNGEPYFIISPVSPLAKQLLGLKLHTSFHFQGRNFTIQQITE